ncbi:hypothetical protein STREPTOSP366_11940 [Streptomyces variabilis]
MARTARTRRGPAGTWSDRRWGLRADACGAGFCAVGAGVAPGVGWWCGAAVGAVVLGLARECVLERFGAWTRQAAAGAHPHPVPSPPWAAAPTPVAEAAIRRPGRAAASASVADCGHSCLRQCLKGLGGAPGRWGYLPLERSREWGRAGAAAPCQRAPRIAPTPVLAPRALRAVVLLGGRRVRRHPTGPHPLLRGPGSPNPGPSGGQGCPSRRAVRRSGRRAAPACPARRRAPRPGGQWSVPGRSPWRAPDRPFR